MIFFKKLLCKLLHHKVSMNEYFIITGQIPGIELKKVTCKRCGVEFKT